MWWSNEFVNWWIEWIRNNIVVFQFKNVLWFLNLNSNIWASLWLRKERIYAFATSNTSLLGATWWYVQSQSHHNHHHRCIMTLEQRFGLMQQNLMIRIQGFHNWMENPILRRWFVIEWSFSVTIAANTAVNATAIFEYWWWSNQHVPDTPPRMPLQPSQPPVSYDHKVRQLLSDERNQSIFLLCIQTVEFRYGMRGCFP